MNFYLAPILVSRLLFLKSISMETGNLAIYSFNFSRGTLVRSANSSLVIFMSPTMFWLS